MKVTFVVDCELEICVELVDDEPRFESEAFKAGETLNFVEIIDENAHTVDFQFGDGSVACGVPRSILKIEEDNE